MSRTFCLNVCLCVSDDCMFMMLIIKGKWLHLQTEAPVAALLTTPGKSGHRSDTVIDVISFCHVGVSVCPRWCFCVSTPFSIGACFPLGLLRDSGTCKTR